MCPLRAASSSAAAASPRDPAPATATRGRCSIAWTRNATRALGAAIANIFVQLSQFVRRQPVAVCDKVIKSDLCTPKRIARLSSVLESVRQQQFVRRHLLLAFRHRLQPLPPIMRLLCSAMTDHEDEVLVTDRACQCEQLTDHIEQVALRLHC